MESNTLGEFLVNYIASQGNFKCIARGDSLKGYKIFAIAEGSVASTRSFDSSYSHDLDSNTSVFALIQITSQFKYSYKIMDGCEYELVIKIKSTDDSLSMIFFDKLNRFF